MLLWERFPISSHSHFPSLSLLQSSPASASHPVVTNGPWATQPWPQDPITTSRLGGLDMVLSAHLSLLTCEMGVRVLGRPVQGWEGLGTEPGLRKG